MNILLVGNGAREHAIAEAIMRSNRSPSLFVYMKANNPGIAALADKVAIGEYGNLADIKNFAQDQNVKFAIIGPEDPLVNGVADALEEVDIPTVGPRQAQAKLESSKYLCRMLLLINGIPGNPWFRPFTNKGALAKYIRELFTNKIPFVLKPDGLTGGKGVMVQGDHFGSLDQAIPIAEKMFKEHKTVLVEEKLEGEEFSLQCLTDGKTVIPSPPVQDHKRRLAGDRGLNTGGMGSYSCANGLLPFLTREELNQALNIVRKTVWAVSKGNAPYRGVIYGGFMLTAKGVKLIEYNVRFGDPEAMNILPLLETDFVDVCLAIIHGKLHEMDVKFKPWNTVVKYVVPKNYGLPPEKQTPSASNLLKIGDMDAGLYHSSIFNDETGLHMTSSRALAVLGVGDFMAEAELIAEAGANAIRGEVAHREDIGTADLIAKRVRHMEELRIKK